MALNEIGIFLTNYRKEINESLRTMANRLGISATYLSAIENGKRNVPNDFIENFVLIYTLNEEQKKLFEKATIMSTSNLKIDITDASDIKKEIIYSIANNDINEQTLQRLSALLKEPQKKEDL